MVGERTVEPGLSPSATAEHTIQQPAQRFAQDNFTNNLGLAREDMRLPEAQFRAKVEDSLRQLGITEERLVRGLGDFAVQARRSNDPGDLLDSLSDYANLLSHPNAAGTIIDANNAILSGDAAEFTNVIQTGSGTSSNTVTFVLNLSSQQVSELRPMIQQNLDLEYNRSIRNQEEQRISVEQGVSKGLREYGSANGMQWDPTQFRDGVTVISTGILASMRHVSSDIKEKLLDANNMEEFMSVASTFLSPREMNAINFYLEVPQMASQVAVEAESIRLMMEQYFQQLEEEGKRRIKEEKEFAEYAGEMEKLSSQAEEARQRFVGELSDAGDHVGLNFLAKAFGPNGCTAEEWRQFWSGGGSHEVASARLEAFREAVRTTVRSAA